MVAFSGGLWWLDFCCLSVLCAVKRRRSLCQMSHAKSTNLLKLRLAMLITMEQVVAQLQQELFTLRAQIAAESGLTDAVRAINKVETAEVRKDTPSLIDVQGFGRPKEWQRGLLYSGRRRRRHSALV